MPSSPSDSDEVISFGKQNQSISEICKYFQDAVFDLFNKKIKSFTKVDNHFHYQKIWEWNDLEVDTRKSVFNKLLTIYDRNIESLPDYKDLRAEIALIKEPQFQFVLLQDYFLKKYDLKTNYYSREIWIYQDELGIYQNIGEAILLKEIHDIIPHYSKQNRNEIIEKIRIKTQFLVNPFNKMNVLVLKDIVINLEDYCNDEPYIYQHSPYYLATNNYLFEYDERATCELIDKFFLDISCNEREFAIEYLLEIFADGLNNHYESQVGHLLIGDGENGKGTFLRLLTAFFGKENITGLSLNQIRENSFQLYKLQTSKINIIGDSSDRSVVDVGTLKKAMGQDLITADVKHAKEPLEFYNNAKIVLSSQYVPRVSEDNFGWFRRWIISQWKFNVEEKITGFEDQLRSEKELAGLLNKVLKVYKKFYHKRFEFFGEESKTKDDKRNEYLIGSNPVKLFVEQFIEFDDPNALIRIESLYLNFKKWQEYNKVNVVKNNTRFGIAFKKAINNEVRIVRPADKNKKRHYEGIRLNHNWSEFILKLKTPTATLISDYLNDVDSFVNVDTIRIDLALKNVHLSNLKIQEIIDNLVYEGKAYESKPGFYRGLT